MNRRMSVRDLADDDPYLIAAVAHDNPEANPDDSDSFHFWSTALVMHVIIGVARAYGAHFPQLLRGWHERTVFNSAQAVTVADEVRFVGDVLDDPLVTTHCQRIADLAARVAASNGRLMLALEGQ
jgi:hypothetical protein